MSTSNSRLTRPRGDGFTEVVVDPGSGAVKSAEKITDPDDLANAKSQKAGTRPAELTALIAPEVRIRSARSALGQPKPAPGRGDHRPRPRLGCRPGTHGMPPDRHPGSNSSEAVVGPSVSWTEVRTSYLRVALWVRWKTAMTVEE